MRATLGRPWYADYRATESPAASRLVNSRLGDVRKQLEAITLLPDGWHIIGVGENTCLLYEPFQGRRILANRHDHCV